MNPAKLVAFTRDELIPTEAKKYAHQIIDKEMPVGLKKYLEVELFLRIHLKIRKGISLSTARQWLHREGECAETTQPLDIFSTPLASPYR